MSELVARTGRHQQRYEAGCRLVAGWEIRSDKLNFMLKHFESTAGTDNGADVLMDGAKTHFFISRVTKSAGYIGRCIPFRYRNYVENDDADADADVDAEKIVEVLMINSTSGPGLLFPKGGWENDETVEEAAVREAIEEAGVRGELMDFIGNYHFKSKTHQDECCPEGLCKASMFALFVKEELESWPEQSTRTRSWLTLSEAVENCRHKWMEEALKQFSIWLADKM